MTDLRRVRLELNPSLLVVIQKTVVVNSLFFQFYLGDAQCLEMLGGMIRDVCAHMISSKLIEMNILRKRNV